MIYAIGKPGELARMFINTSLRESAELQVQEGEVLVETDSTSPATITGRKGAYTLTPFIDEEIEAINLRNYRNSLLSTSDWTQMPDAPLTEDQRQAWRDYRTALRDLPQLQPGATLQTAVWPIPPA